MASEIIEYILRLKDQFSNPIHEANSRVQQLEHSWNRITSAFGIGIGLGFGEQFAREITDFTREGMEVFHKLHEAEGQVEAGLESTRYAAGVTFDELQKGAIKAAQQFKFTQADIMDMQAQLLTFPKVSEKVFGDTQQAVLDMATRLHKGLDETAIMVGKALQDPERGITALRRVGVNFNDTQREIIKHLVETGQAAKAQSMILQELQTEFAGSAKAAADADPLFRFHKIIQGIKIEVGEAATSLLRRLTPALNTIANAFQATIAWMKEHKELMEFIGSAIVGVVSAIGVIIIATKIWTVVQWGLNLAITANPIGMLIVAIGAAVGAVIYCYNHFAKFRAVLWGVWETVKEFGRIVADIFMGLWHVIHGIFTLNSDEIKLGSKQHVDAIFNAGKRLGDAFRKGYEGGMQDFKDQQARDAMEKAADTKSKAAKPIGPIAGTDAPKQTAKVSGQKITSINISIAGGLVHDMKVMISNFHDGTDKIKEMVTRALLGAVNDSQAIAD